MSAIILPKSVMAHLSERVRIAVARSPRMAELRERLLGIGGAEVCFYDGEPDLAKILERGMVWKGYRARVRRGKPCRCHSNVCFLWDDNSSWMRIATGYGLSSDGIWRSHSWCVSLDKEVVYETTVKRIRYYGFVMTERECKNFYDCQAY